MEPPTLLLHSRLEFAGFALDLAGRILVDPSGRDVKLRRREFDLLSTLARNRGRVMSRDTLLYAIAGREPEAFDRAIDLYVGRLRRKIENDPKQPQLIVTIPGIGYRLEAKPEAAKTLGQAGPGRVDERTLRSAVGILTAFNKANAERNANAISSLYAENAISIRSNGPLSGRATIARRCALNYMRYIPDPSILHHVTAIGDSVMLRAGGWSGTYQGQDGPVRLSGSWTTTDLRDGNTWKICTETVLMDSGSYGPFR